MTGAGAMVCTITVVAPFRVDIHGVVAVAASVRRDDFFADFRQNRRCGIAVPRCAEVNEVAQMRRDSAYRPVRSRVLVAGLGVVRAAETDIPTVETGDLVADKSTVTPARAPVDGIRHGRGHNLAAVVGHVRTPAGGDSDSH